MRELRQDPAAALVLAGAADRDVAAIREEIRDLRQATVGTLNALRQTQHEQGEAIQRLTTEVRGKFDQTAAGQTKIAEMLQILIDQQDDH